MRLVLAAVFATGCAAGAESVDVTPDAAVAEPDAAAGNPETARACDIGLKDTTGITRGHLGGTGGGKGPILACEDLVNQRVIGVAVRMSNQNTVFGGRSAHGIGLLCGHVTIDASGNPTVEAASSPVEISGLGTSGWSPSTWTQVTQCKPGWVVSGMTARAGASNNMFLDVSIVCSKLGADGSTSTSETLKIVGSLTGTSTLQTAKCAAGEVVAQLGTWTGAGLDALDLSCSRPTCR